MLTDESYFDNLRLNEAPSVSNSLCDFISLTLRNHYQDTFLGPLPEGVQRLVDALEATERSQEWAHDS
jgi:hypothetical protein